MAVYRGKTGTVQFGGLVMDKITLAVFAGTIGTLAHCSWEDWH